jgi:hypothetical protein
LEAAQQALLDEEKEREEAEAAEQRRLDALAA